jgi:hypothetical protein
MSRKCYQCERNNPADQAFCGGCGSALALNDYISKKVEERLRDAIRDRDVVETESSIKVFERAWGWVKIVGGIATVLLALVGVGVFWKVSDWWKSVDSAKQSVISTAATTRNEIGLSSAHSLQEITTASENARKASESTAADASRQSRELQRTTLQTKAELSREAASVRSEVEKSRSQLQAASKLQPEMMAMQQQLAQATTAIQAQQKVISSSEEFVKSVFSSHVVQIFNIGQPPKDRYAVVPPTTKENKNTVVFLLLNATPIQGTLQLQYHIYAQPPDSYFNIHNLVLFFWADPADNLRQKPLSVSYFPDKSDKEMIHSLSEHDGRVFADDQPLPKFGEPDPTFGGNKWMQFSPSPAKP